MSKKRFDFITIGGATRDIMFYTDKGVIIQNKKDIKIPKLLAFEQGNKILIDQANFTLGGGAINTSIALNQLGFKVAPVICLGKDDNGTAVIQKLQQNKINLRFVQINQSVPTGFSIIVMPVGQVRSRQYIAFLHRGANEQLILAENFWKQIKPRWLYVTSLPEKSWLKIFKSIQHIVIQRRSKLIWNPGRRQLLQAKQVKKFLPLVEVLILNKDEAIELSSKLGTPANKLKNINFLAKNLFHYGPQIVVITNGSKGAIAYDGEKFYRQPAVGKKIKDTTGVGDAFGTGFVAGLIYYNYDIKKALILGAKNSGSVIATIGAQNGLLSKNDI